MEHTEETTSPEEKALVRQEARESRALAIEALKDNPSLFLNVVKFEHAQRVGNMLAAATMVPDHFQQNLGNCMIALNYADRTDVDVFMLMQALYVVHGKPGIEGKMVIALINRSGLFKGPLQWRFEGTQGSDKWTCIAFATHKESGELLELDIDWATVKAEGWVSKAQSKWKTMPKQMFRYRTASWFANTYCPEVKMGMQTVEELKDIGVTTVYPDDEGSYSVSESAEDLTKKVIAEAMKEKAKDDAPAETPPKPQKEEATPDDTVETKPKDVRDVAGKALEEINAKHAAENMAAQRDAKEYDGPWCQKNWHNKRTGKPHKKTGFFGFALTFNKEWHDAPEDLKAASRTKFAEFYGEGMEFPPTSAPGKPVQETEEQYPVGTVLPQQDEDAAFDELNELQGIKDQLAEVQFDDENTWASARVAAGVTSSVDELTLEQAELWYNALIDMGWKF